MRTLGRLGIIISIYLLMGCSTLTQKSSPVLSPRFFTLGLPRRQQSQIRITWLHHALTHGAPAQTPPLLALESHNGKISQFRFLALGTLVWEIDVTKEGITEKKAPWVPARLDVTQFLDDWALAKRTQQNITSAYQGLHGRWILTTQKENTTCWSNQNRVLCVTLKDKSLTLTRRRLGYQLTITFL